MLIMNVEGTKMLALEKSGFCLAVISTLDLPLGCKVEFVGDEC